MANAYVHLQGRWVGGVKKAQKYAYVIFEWSLWRKIYICKFVAVRQEFSKFLSSPEQFLKQNIFETFR